MKGVTHWEIRGFVVARDTDFSEVIGDLPFVDNRVRDPELLAQFLVEQRQMSAARGGHLRLVTSAARQALSQAEGRPERSSPLITGPVKGF